MKIKASSLPKLALCGQYESAPGESSEAAQRGTRIDAMMRHMWATGEVPDGAEDEIQLAHWACQQLLALGDNHATRVAEQDCRIYVPIIKYVGTMDALNPRGLWLADLKSGQEHDYRAQMAAYALGCMVEYQSPAWTTHLLFCDQKKVVSTKWTLTEACETVQAAADNVGTAPVLNDYCAWCAKSLTCEARVDAVGKTMTATASMMPVAQDTGFLEMIADPERLGLFLSRAKVFDDFREAAEAKAREMLAAGVDVPGWKLGTPRTRKSVNLLELWKIADLPLPKILEAAGSISLKEATELAGKVPNELVKVTHTKAPLQSA